MIQIIWNPTTRVLRQFAGFWFPLFCVMVGIFLGRAAGHWPEIQKVWILMGVLAVAGLVRPAIIRPVFVGLMVLTYPLGFIVSHVLLAGIFLCVLTPIGLVRRFMGADALNLRNGKRRDTLWIKSSATQMKSRYTRPY